MLNNLPILKWPFKLEKEFQWALNKQLVNRWDYVYKFPDTWYAKKPYDFICINSKWFWLTYHIELKIINIDTININKLEPQQHYYLNHISHINPDIALVWVWSKRHNEYKMFKYLDFMTMADSKWSVKIF